MIFTTKPVYGLVLSIHLANPGVIRLSSSINNAISGKFNWHPWTEFIKFSGGTNLWISQVKSFFCNSIFSEYLFVLSDALKSKISVPFIILQFPLNKDNISNYPFWISIYYIYLYDSFLNSFYLLYKFKRNLLGLKFNSFSFFEDCNVSGYVVTVFCCVRLSKNENFLLIS